MADVRICWNSVSRKTARRHISNARRHHRAILFLCEACSDQSQRLKMRAAIPGVVFCDLSEISEPEI